MTFMTQVTEATIIDYIEAARIERGISKSAMCRKSGLSLRNYYRILQSKQVSLSVALDLLRALGLTITITKHEKVPNSRGKWVNLLFFDG